MLSLAVRAETAPPSVAAIERVVHELNATLPVADVRPLSAYVEGAFSTMRFVTALLATLAVLATTLAAIGVYGVLAYLTAQRMRELGLRLALGATRREMTWFVLWEGMIPVIGGIVVGVSLAAMLSGTLSRLVYGVRPFDVTTVGIVTCAILAISLAACITPAWRAGRTDPLVALRHD